MTLLQHHYYVAPAADWKYYTVCALVAVPDLLLLLFSMPVSAWINRNVTLSKPVTPRLIQIVGLCGLLLPAIRAWLVHYHQPVCVGCYSK